MSQTVGSAAAALGTLIRDLLPHASAGGHSHVHIPRYATGLVLASVAEVQSLEGPSPTFVLGAGGGLLRQCYSIALD